MSDQKPWYKDGLPFSCTECGKCCTGEPGYVWVTIDEIEMMAKELEMPLDLFTKKYIRRAQGRFSLKEKPRSYDCVFLENQNQCKLYKARPKQCRTFPFWEENLTSKKAWDEAAKHCEGMRIQNAPIIPLHQIQKCLDDMEE